MDDEASPITADAAIEARKLEFSLFYREDMPSFVTFLIVKGVPPLFATDLAQEAMTKAFQCWDDLHAPRAWVRTVAVRQWWRLSEARRLEIPAESLPEASGLLAEGHAEQVIHRHAFLAAIQDLSAAKREALAWTYDGYLPNEIADLMGTPVTRVRSMLRDARAALRKRQAVIEEKP